MRRWSPALIALLIAVPSAACQPTPTVLHFSLRRSGQQLIDYDGNPVRCRGYNRPGMEYRPLKTEYPGFISDDPPGTDGRSEAYIDALVANAVRWNINCIRIPINESAWLGQGVAPYVGEPYRHFLQHFVLKLGLAHIYPIIDVHRTATDGLAEAQDIMPDLRAVTVWGQIADTFKNCHACLFDIAQEPHPECAGVVDNPVGCSSYATENAVRWDFYRDGGAYMKDGQMVEYAGTQQILDAIRDHASNVVMVSCLSFGTYCDRWQDSKPIDPLDQLAVTQHLYSNSGLNLVNDGGGQYDDNMSALEVQYPVIVGETGSRSCEGLDLSDGVPDFVARTIVAFEARPIDGLLMWSDDSVNETCSSFTTLKGLPRPGIVDGQQVRGWGNVVWDWLHTPHASP